MTTGAYATYEEAAGEYLARFNALLAAPRDAAGPAVRSAGAPGAETLIEQADGIADISAGMVPLARGYLDADDPALREGISAQLLAQAAAELQVAAELLQVTEGEEEAGRTTRAAGGVGLSQAIGALEHAMAIPVADGLAPFVPTRRDIWIAPTDPEQALQEAKDKLRTAATTTVDGISANVCEFGGDVAFDLIFNTKWTAVLRAPGCSARTSRRSWMPCARAQARFSPGP